MKKRISNYAQVSIFIIVGLVIIAIVIGIIFFNKQEKGTNISEEFFSSLETKSEFSSLSNSILNCMEEVTRESLFYIGLRGGYYDRPENYYDLDFVFIPYYYYNGILNIPSKEIIQEEIGKYVDDNLEDCFNQEIKTKDINTHVKIEEINVNFVINSKINFKKEDSVFLVDLREHPVSHKSSLNDIIDVADYFVEERTKEMICVSCLEDLLIEKDVFLNSIDLEKQNELVIISENRTSDEVYAFEFMIQEKSKEVNISNMDLDALFGE